MPGWQTEVLLEHWVRSIEERCRVEWLCKVWGSKVRCWMRCWVRSEVRSLEVYGSLSYDWYFSDCWSSCYSWSSWDNWSLSNNWSFDNSWSCSSNLRSWSGNSSWSSELSGSSNAWSWSVCPLRSNALGWLPVVVLSGRPSRRTTLNRSVCVSGRTTLSLCGCATGWC